jgi:hypothetical protein
MQSVVFDVMSEIDRRCTAHRKMAEGRYDLRWKPKFYYTCAGKKQPLTTKYKRNMLKVRFKHEYIQTCHHLMREFHMRGARRSK